MSADDRDAFIAEHIGRMTTREIAAALGINQSNVSRRAKKLGLSAKAPARRKRAAKPPPAPTHRAELMDSPRDEHLARLREAREIVLAEMRRCEGSALAHLSKEYRALCDEVRREEEAGNGDEGSGGLSSIVALFGGPDGLPGADVEGGPPL